MHGAAGHDELASGRRCRITDALQTCDVGGERRHRDAALGLLDDVRDRFRDLDLGGRAALAHDVGRIADQRVHAFLAEGGELGVVGWIADQRRGVELPVAGVEHHAVRGAECDAGRLGNRVGERDELEIERADIEAAAELGDGDRAASGGSRSRRAWPRACRR